MLNLIKHLLPNPRKGSYSIMEFGECINEYIQKNPGVSVDKDSALKAFIDGRIGFDLVGIERYIKK